MTSPEQPQPAAIAELSENLRNVLKLMVREIRRDAERHDNGLSMLQSALLACVDEQPGIGVAALARMQNVRSPTMSGQVKALEAAGMLARAAPDPSDRRRSGLQLTAAGQARLQALRTRRLDWLAQRIARLSPAQMAALAAAIEPLALIARP